jgi:hypothetical protein
MAEIFVLMPFGSRFRNVYELVLKPLAMPDHVVHRADDLPFSTHTIYDQVVSAIDRADVIVADLSDANPNVYYELGYAHARGRVVVPISSTPPLPFNVAGFQTVLYDPNDLPALRAALEARVAQALALRAAAQNRAPRATTPVDDGIVGRVERFAVERAGAANWARPAMYFTQDELVVQTGISAEDSYRALDALRNLGRVACVNWQTEPVWMATGRH